MDYTLEPLINCRNKLCKAYFHKTCWAKYLKINNLRASECKVCYNGEIKVVNAPDNGEVEVCSCLHFFRRGV